jgi:hypothetical protein
MHWHKQLLVFCFGNALLLVGTSDEISDGGLAKSQILLFQLSVLSCGTRR